MTAPMIFAPLDAALLECAIVSASWPLGFFAAPGNGPKPATRTFSLAIKARAAWKFRRPRAQAEVFPPSPRSPAPAVSPCAWDRCAGALEFAYRSTTTPSALVAHGAGRRIRLFPRAARGELRSPARSPRCLRRRARNRSRREALLLPHRSPKYGALPSATKRRLLRARHCRRRPCSPPPHRRVLTVPS